MKSLTQELDEIHEQQQLAIVSNAEANELKKQIRDMKAEMDVLKGQTSIDDWMKDKVQMEISLKDA